MYSRVVAAFTTLLGREEQQQQGKEQREFGERSDAKKLKEVGGPNEVGAISLKGLVEEGDTEDSASVEHRQLDSPQ